MVPDPTTTPQPAATSPFDLLLSIALDLTASLTAADRYRRLVAAVQRVLGCDAAVLLRRDGELLVPVAAHGLSPEALGVRFQIAEHPRLVAICAAHAPVLFPPDTSLPDPFDGRLADAPGANHRIHACLGAPLWVAGELVGALTAEAVEPHRFDRFEPAFLAALGALCGAAMRTSDLMAALERHAARQGLVAQDLQRQAQQQHGGLLLGDSGPMQRLRQEIDLVAGARLTVLITGETGVGKELVARTLHAASERAQEPLIYVNCAALPESVAESELFGHRRGAFTGADKDRPGKLEVADGGTLFLDEIGELPLSIQPKLLRALQQGEIQRVGADRPLQVDVRVLAATNRDLAREVAAGRFRADLFHRLDVYRLHVPPLRERRSDIPLLAGWSCDLQRRRLGLGPVRLDRAALAQLASYDWPGNVRELENLLSRAVLRASSRVPRGEPVLVLPADLGLDATREPSVSPEATEAPAPAAAVAPVQPLREAVDTFQRQLIQRAVDEAGGNWAAAARRLGMNRSNLHHLATRLGLRGG